MKITILTPQSEFNQAQRTTLSRLGDVVYASSREALSFSQLITLCKNTDILAIEPDIMGGFEKVPELLPKLLDQIPSIRSLALGTTSYGYIDKDYCLSRGIVVTNLPGYTSESIAEHTIAMLLGCSKRLFLLDRRAQKGQYKEELGREIASKTLGIIGLGHIGTKTAKLAKALGMKVLYWNRTPKKVAGFKSVPLNELFSESDYLSLHLKKCPETTNFLNASNISQLKKGAMIINTASRGLVDESVMAKGLKSGTVDSYALEAEDLTSGPLSKVENAFMFKAFGWYTKEVLDRRTGVWVNNIVGLAHNKPVNQVY